MPETRFPVLDDDRSLASDAVSDATEEIVTVGDEFVAATCAE